MVYSQAGLNLTSLSDHKSQTLIKLLSFENALYANFTYSNLHRSLK
ncbi:6783_t:CDS:2 [Acaulospora colombiana]|uniref:6783_t:CDS:1 n=1 Tax=Acaulospora colombiana TaxID=27376 RepID=A0ACA9KJI5_9GLOM|nr:6783_t:CDS:2 [Acaulospora colombiana]